ncbi:chromosome-associated kinesin KIF4A isoform X2 [Ceratitis capitata]|uniref:chromosome-associated kinesin KIF4A isoform X2 n=1 Tax=Ceratitis capitata TaxID=7213 RepID=UPI00061893B8|nr:chromosome-associated kinesin KIF4A isoform X2 [Ceratitis capitata]
MEGKNKISAMGDVDNVRVAVRIRPLVPSERDLGCQEAVERVGDSPQVIVNRSDTFTFNYVFDARDTQDYIYDVTVTDLLEKFFSGFNATILAYGQTGSGKTHTMGTAYNGALDENAGIIPRIMRDIFERIQKLVGEFEFVVKCSFMELYQEQLYDLLSDQPREQAIVEMRENRNGVVMPGLTEMLVSSAGETAECLLRGSTGRAVAATAMNEQSSRSHAIFTITVEATKKDELSTVTTSKFHLVDLAGSERSKKTQATGDRFKEGVKINQGLLALGNVISALGSGQGSGFVRYRDSKLTRLLQDSLGGNSITLMIACVSPADYNVAETLGTLRYADRARKIKNKPVVNQDPHAAEVNHLKSIIQKLRVELLAAGGGTAQMSSSLNSALQGIPPPSGPATTIINTNGEMAKKYQLLQEKYHTLQQQFQATLHDVAEHEMRAHITEEAHEKLKSKMVELKLIANELGKNYKVNASLEEQEATGERIKQMNQLVDGLDVEMERTQTEIENHKRATLNGSDGGDDDDDARSALMDVHSQMQEQTDAYTTIQMDYKEQLRRINRELNLKEELHHRVAGNLVKFCTLEDNTEEKFKECEKKIQELEDERNQLLDKLRHVKENASAKLAEERRKRLQTLEHEIGEMKRKNTQQAKLLKVREKETQKIQNLNTEIQAMKESKVKLIRAMRQESENFRQWKMSREKELIQLRNKDRKLKNEMARKEALHTKQRNVLKRKCEEALAINKRLKDALDRQRVAQSQRQKTQSAKDINSTTNKVDQVVSWVERELEVIVTLIDAEHSLEQLMEDRVIITTRIAELQKQQPETGSGAAQELDTLQEDLEMRNAQITDLQQKVCSIDLESRMRALYDGIQSVPEARAVLRKVLKSISDMRREHAVRIQEQKIALDEQIALREAAEQTSSVAAKRMRLMELEHEEAIAERENTYEEKIAVLLRELHNAPQLAVGSGEALTPEQEERLKIQEEQLNKMDTIREELEYYKNLVNELQQAVQAKGTRKKEVFKKVKKQETIDLDDDDDDDAISLSSEADFDDSDDPDWKKTPGYRRKTRSNRLTNSRNASTDNDTFTTATSNPDTKHKLVKRKFTGCKCRKDCINKRCGCYSFGEKCSERCHCGDACKNGKNATDNDDEENGENIENKQTVASDGNDNISQLVTEQQSSEGTPPKVNVSLSVSGSNDVSKDAESTFVKPNPTYLTPKMVRLSTISYDLPSTKKKFFQ